MTKSCLPTGEPASTVKEMLASLFTPMVPSEGETFTHLGAPLMANEVLVLLLFLIQLKKVNS